jgi:hypothetical protein
VLDKPACLLVVLTLLGMAAAGCGGGSTTGSTGTTASVSPLKQAILAAAYRAQVNRICGAGDSRLTGLSSDDRIVRIETQLVARIRSLSPPAPERVAVNRWLGSVGRALSATRVMAEAKRTSRRWNLARFAYLAQSDTAFVDAKRLGLTRCVAVGAI